MKLDARRYNLDTILTDCLDAIVRQINGVTEGRNAFLHSATDTTPTRTTGYENGDFVPKKTKAEAGVVTAKYVIQGWDLVDVAGTLTWKERRTLTGA